MSDNWWWILVPIAVLGGIALGIVLMRQPVTSTLATPVISNAETWEWVDYQNRPRKIVVHREIKESR